MSKGLKTIRVEKLPTYIRKSTDANELIQIAVRIPLTLRDAFERAQAQLQAHGYDMQMSELVRYAIQDACAVVHSMYGHADNSLGANSQRKRSEANKAVEHSSRKDVEECGAMGGGDDKSPPSIAPPLTGSGLPFKAAPGVELPEVEVGHGTR